LFPVIVGEPANFVDEEKMDEEEKHAKEPPATAAVAAGV
jgi:hypothetical protein